MRSFAVHALRLIALTFCFTVACAMQNPEPALAMRDKAAEVWVVELKEMQRQADPRQQEEPVRAQVVIKEVERSAVGMKPGDVVCVAYSASNPDYRGITRPGLLYPPLMSSGVVYRVWLTAPQRAGDCFSPGADWASINRVSGY